MRIDTLRDICVLLFKGYVIHAQAEDGAWVTVGPYREASGKECWVGFRYQPLPEDTLGSREDIFDVAQWFIDQVGCFKAEEGARAAARISPCISERAMAALFPEVT